MATNYEKYFGTPEKLAQVDIRNSITAGRMEVKVTITKSMRFISPEKFRDWLNEDITEPSVSTNFSKYFADPFKVLQTLDALDVNWGHVGTSLGLCDGDCDECKLKAKPCSYETFELWLTQEGGEVTNG